MKVLFPAFFILNINLIQFYASLPFPFGVHIQTITEVKFIKQSFLISKNKLWKWKLVFPTVKRTRAGRSKGVTVFSSDLLHYEENKEALHFDGEAFV